MDAKRADRFDKTSVHHGVPWEESYGYAQAILVGDQIYISGQLSHDAAGNFIGPAALDETGSIVDFSVMELQMRTTYQNAGRLLEKLGADWGNVVEETLFVLDIASAFAAAGKVRAEFYGEPKPRVASNLIGVSHLALPEQVIEVAFRADLRAR